MVVVILVAVLASNNFFSTKIPSESPTPATYALTIRYSETHRETWDSGVELWITMTAQNHEESARNMILNNFYLTVNGVEIASIGQTLGNFIVDPDSSHEASMWIQVEEIGSNYQLNYRDSSFSIEWINETPAPTPTPVYAVTLKYKETERRILNSSDVADPTLVGYTFVSIALTVHVNDGNPHSFAFENFYLTINGVEITATKQLDGTWAFNVQSDSQVWFMFKEIGTNYELNYRGASFSIEWRKQ